MNEVARHQPDRIVYKKLAALEEQQGAKDKAYAWLVKAVEAPASSEPAAGQYEALAEWQEHYYPLKLPSRIFPL